MKDSGYGNVKFGRQGPGRKALTVGFDEQVNDRVSRSLRLVITVSIPTPVDITTRTDGEEREELGRPAIYTCSRALGHAP